MGRPINQGDHDQTPEGIKNFRIERARIMNRGELKSTKDGDHRGVEFPKF